MENSVDPTHTYYLHSHMLKLKGDADHVPYHYRMLNKFDFEFVQYPNWAGIQKQRIFEGEDVPAETPHPLIFPNILFVPVRIGYAMHFRTPIDDTNTQVYQFRFSPNKDRSAVDQPENTPVTYVGTTDEAGEFHMDNFTSQDHMAWETQGPLADRSKEHLAEGDRGIIMFRKLLREQIQLAQSGGDPVGVNFDPRHDETIELIHDDAYNAFSFAAARQA
jgi:5,5'-dehydrodivanillate O-demethylase oxygenase subunit